MTCGVDVIAGDHSHCDPGALACGHSIGDLFANWIFDANYAKCCEVIFMGSGEEIFGLGSYFSSREVCSSEYACTVMSAVEAIRV